MSKPYRLTIRLNPDISKEKAIMDYLANLENKSINSFVIDALEYYISDSNDKLLNEIRQIFREEVHTLPVQTAENNTEWSPQLSEVESKENEQNVLDDLEMFG